MWVLSACLLLLVPRFSTGKFLFATFFETLSQPLSCALGKSTVIILLLAGPLLYISSSFPRTYSDARSLGYLLFLPSFRGGGLLGLLSHKANSLYWLLRFGAND